MVHHPTSRCFVFKDNIQTLVEAGVLILKSEQKKVTDAMVTLNFENFLKVTVQDRLIPSQMENGSHQPICYKVGGQGPHSVTTKFGKIMWVHPDIANDKQWDSSQPKLKGKSCNVISLSQEDM